MLFTKFGLMGKSLRKYDREHSPTFETDPNSKGAKAVESYLFENFIKPAQSGGSQLNKLSAKRDRFEAAGLARDFDAEFKEDIAEYSGLKVTGEWTLVKGTDPKRRILYLHGGAFTVGSAISHRAQKNRLRRFRA